MTSNFVSKPIYVDCDDIDQNDSVNIMTSSEIYIDLVIDGKDLTCKYIGMMKDNKPHGLGIITNDQEGFSLSTLWKEGKMVNEKLGIKYERSNGKTVICDYNSGVSEIIWDNGEHFKGEILNGQPYLGLMKYQDGTIFYGKFHEGKKSLFSFASSNIIFSLSDYYNCNIDSYKHCFNPFKRSLFYNDSFYKYNDGNIYIGDWLNGKRTRSGVLFNKNVQLFGEWKDDKLNGNVVIRYNSGDNETKVELSCKDDVIGQTSIHYPNQDIFEGSVYETSIYDLLKDFPRKKEGILTNNGIQIFNGTWKNNGTYDKGIKKVDNIVYNGTWNDDNKFIKGTFDKQDIVFTGEYTYKDNIIDTFIGEIKYPSENPLKYQKGTFDKNDRIIKGIREYTDGLKEEGSYQNGYLIKGIKHTVNGNIYDGEYTSNNIVKGKITFPNKTVFEGDFHKNYTNQLKIGKKIYGNGEIYDGEFITNGMLIKGIITKSNGDYQNGEWKTDGTFNGKIKKTFNCGDIYEGDVIDNIYHGNGTMIYSSCSRRYVGEWKNGLRCGKGVLYGSDCNKIIQEGVWVDGVYDQQDNGKKRKIDDVGEASVKQVKKTPKIIDDVFDFDTDGIPTDFQCPICLQIMNDPVVCSNGTTYCEECISKWCRKTKYKDPNGGNDTLSKQRHPNVLLRRMIITFLENKEKHNKELENTEGSSSRI